MWPFRAEPRRRDREMRADLVVPDPVADQLAELAAQLQAEVARLTALAEPTMILESGVRVPGYLARGTDWE